MNPAVIFRELIADRTSRCCGLQQNVEADIMVMLAKPIVDAAEWVLTGRGTRIGQLPGDMRRATLEPYIRRNGKILGICHGGSDRYGVTDGRHVDIRGTIRYFVLGRLHRKDGPAIVFSNKYMYYRRGQPRRKSGPVSVYRNYLELFRPALAFRLNEVGCGQDLTINFANVSVRLNAGATFVTCEYRGRMPFVHIDANGTLRFVRGHRTLMTARSDVFVHLVAGLRRYVESLDIPGWCEREWYRTQAELRKHQDVSE